ncbi:MULTISPECIES: hypothetical protein [Streptomyces]|uniref:Uncharacterized protein n=1 Tax=Streptomyces bangladeshensis TaxID=295352 RepID=A0ABN3BWJ3_9ACTN|nr:hypothetical protein EASAB2608_08026 [Streptomyces sp. EAS-AB2608]
MTALVAVMVMVSVGTFDWHSVAPKTLKRMPAVEITGLNDPSAHLHGRLSGTRAAGH